MQVRNKIRNWQTKRTRQAFGFIVVEGIKLAKMRYKRDKIYLFRNLFKTKLEHSKSVEKRDTHYKKKTCGKLFSYVLLLI
jgi:hypothetical protein